MFYHHNHHHHIKRQQLEDELNPYKLPPYNPMNQSDDNFDINSINSLESFGPSFPHIDNYAHLHHHKKHGYPGRGLPSDDDMPSHHHSPQHHKHHHKHIVKPAATIPGMSEWEVRKIAHHLARLVEMNEPHDIITQGQEEGVTSHNELLLLIGMGILIFGGATLVSGVKF
jgi:hypothetical protein